MSFKTFKGETIGSRFRVEKDFIVDKEKILARAIDQDDQGRRYVALKFVKILDESHETSSRSQLEIVASRHRRLLKHSNIIQLYDDGCHFFKNTVKAYYFALEWMTYASINAWMSSRRRDEDYWVSATRIVHDACTGIAGVHSENFIHLDISPNNILLDENGVAKISDFDSMVEVDSDLPVLAPKHHGGTSCYCSPELAIGQKIDKTTDLYSLGAVYFRLLTGKDPTRPGDDPTELDREIPKICAEIVQKATNEHRNRRYQSALEMQAALEGVLAKLTNQADYLDWVIHANSKIQLPLIARDADLDEIYICLRIDETSSMQRRDFSELIANRLKGVATSEDNNTDEIADKIAHSPLFLTSDTACRQDSNKSLTLADAYEKFAVFVILGHPGSGKSTIGRWLAKAAAQARRRYEPEFKVDAQHIDPSAEAGAPLINFGPTPFPIFMRAADYADFLQVDPRPLCESLGHLIETVSICKIGIARSESVKLFLKEAVDVLIKKAIQEQSLLLIIDGIDEIASVDNRDMVCKKIREFLDSCVFRSNSKIGNRVIMTSRVVGYDDNRLDDDRIGHLSVEPLNRPAIQRLMETCLKAAEPDSPEKSAAGAQTLINLIYFGDRKDLQGFVNNPLLAGLIAVLFYKNRKKLPKSLVEIFKEAVNVFVDVWEERGRGNREPHSGLISGNGWDDKHRNKILRQLERLATTFHECSNGLLEEPKVHRELKNLVCAVQGETDDTLADTDEIGTDIDDLLRIFGESLGLIIPFQNNVFGFYHRLFQEYLVGCHLLSESDNPQILADNVRAHYGSPRWQEPLKLALCKYFQENPSEFRTLAKDLLNQDGAHGVLLPQGALLLVQVLGDLPDPPQKLVDQIVERLLRATIEGSFPTRFDIVRDLIDNAIKAIRKIQPKAAEHAVIKALNNSENDRGLVLAAAALVQRTEWFSISIGKALMGVRTVNDSYDWNWPIDSALREMASPLPPPSAPVQMIKGGDTRRSENQPNDRADLQQIELERSKYRENDRLTPRYGLPTIDLPMRQKLLDFNQQSLQFIEKEPDWLKLVIGIYGGVADFRAADRMRNYYQLSNFLQFPDSLRNAYRNYLRQSWGHNDPVYQMAVDLETKANRWKEGWQSPPDFHPRFIARDSCLTKSLIWPALDARRPALSLVEGFRERCRIGTEAEQADAALGLVLLGETQSADVQAMIRQPHVRDRLRLAFSALQDPLTRSASSVTRRLARLVETDPANWSDVFSAILEITIADSPAFVDTLDLYKAVRKSNNAAKRAPGSGRIDPIDSAQVLAEFLSSRFLGGVDDAFHNTAMALENMTRLEIDPQDLVRAIALVPLARHSRRPVKTYTWDVEQLPLRYFDEDDIPGFVMTALENIDFRISMVKGWAIRTLFDPSKDRSKVLKSELLALVLRDVGVHSNRTEMIEWLDSRLADSPDVARQVLNEAKELGSPYYKARTLLRLLPLFHQQRDEVFHNACKSLSQIKDHLKRETVFEQLLISLRPRPRHQGPSERPKTSTPWDDRVTLVESATRAAQLISNNHDDKARAMARLAFHVHRDSRQAYLKRAYYLAKKIPDNCAQNRNETLRLLLPLLQALQIKVPADLVGKLQTITPPLRRSLAALYAESEPDPTKEDEPLTRDYWPTLVAASEIRDALIDDPDAARPERLWNKIARGELNPAMDSLKKLAQLEGLALTCSAALIIDRLEEAVLKDVEPLIPDLNSAQPETMPILVDWLLNRKGTLQRQAALLLAERKGLSLETWLPLADALTDPDDMIRARVSQVVHHPHVNPERGPVLPASTIGVALLESIFQAKIVRSLKDYSISESAQTALALGPEKGQERIDQTKANRIARMGSNLVFDDPKMIVDWVRAVREDPYNKPEWLEFDRLRPADSGRRGHVAQEVLSSIEACTDDVWPELMNGLKEGPIPVRAAILRSVMVMIQRATEGKATENKLTTVRWNDCFEILETLTAEELPQAPVDLRNEQSMLNGLIRTISLPESKGLKTESPFHQIGLNLDFDKPLAELIKAPPEYPDDSIVMRIDAAFFDSIGTAPPSSTTTSTSVEKSRRLLTLFLALANFRLLSAMDSDSYLEPSDSTRELLRKHPEVVSKLFRWLETHLSTDRSVSIFADFSTDLLRLTAHAASVDPSKFAKGSSDGDLVRWLVKTVLDSPRRGSRSAAVHLLGHHLIAKNIMIPALASALLDVDDVRNAALKAVGFFQNYEPGFVERLAGDPKTRTGLYHRSAIAAYAFAGMLATLARTEADRTEILGILAKAIHDPINNRPIHFAYSVTRGINPPRLNEELYRKFLNVAGVAIPARRRAASTIV